MFFEEKALQFAGDKFLDRALGRVEYVLSSVRVIIRHFLCQMAVETLAEIEHLVPREVGQKVSRCDGTVFMQVRVNPRDALELAHDDLPTPDVLQFDKPVE